LRAQSIKQIVQLIPDESELLFSTSDEELDTSGETSELMATLQQKLIISTHENATANAAAEQKAPTAVGDNVETGNDAIDETSRAQKRETIRKISRA
jgi:hypothetical protein